MPLVKHRQIDAFLGAQRGRDDVVIKPLQNIRPKGVAGATLSGDGAVVLVLDMEDLLSNDRGDHKLARTGNMPMLEAAAV